MQNSFTTRQTLIWIQFEYESMRCMTSALKNSYANACWRISCISTSEGTRKKNRRATWFTIYSFFRILLYRLTESTFNLQHLSLFRHVKTINFAETMMITSSQYVSCDERQQKPKVEYLCLFSFSDNFKQCESFKFRWFAYNGGRSQKACDWFSNSMGKWGQCCGCVVNIIVNV